MALIRTSQILNSVSGRVSGMTAARDRSGLHLRTSINRVRRKSTLQHKRRNAFRGCLSFREENITTIHVEAWLRYAQRLASTNALGEKITLTWWNAFLHINIIRIYNDLPILEYPPE